MGGGILALHTHQLSAFRSGRAPLRIAGFTKPFRELGFEETADFVAAVGWDGVELPVREKSTHLRPERVEEDLPRMVEALRAREKEVLLLATDIVSPDESAERILRTAVALGIRRYRLGAPRYDLRQPIRPQLEALRPQFRELAALNRELGVLGALQNHSGGTYVGGSIWDAHLLFEDLPADALGLCFDIGHATLEGGRTFDLDFRLVKDRVAAIFVKDFHWERQGERWNPVWGPLGSGMVERRWFTDLAASPLDVPFVQHHEYPLEPGKDLLTHCREDLRVLREWLQVG